MNEGKESHHSHREAEETGIAAGERFLTPEQRNALIHEYNADFLTPEEQDRIIRELNVEHPLPRTDITRPPQASDIKESHSRDVPRSRGHARNPLAPLERDRIIRELNAEHPLPRTDITRFPQARKVQESLSHDVSHRSAADELVGALADNPDAEHILDTLEQETNMRFGDSIELLSEEQLLGWKGAIGEKTSGVELAAWLRNNAPKNPILKELVRMTTAKAGVAQLRAAMHEYRAGNPEVLLHMENFPTELFLARPEVSKGMAKMIAGLLNSILLSMISRDVILDSTKTYNPNQVRKALQIPQQKYLDLRNIFALMASTARAANGLAVGEAPMIFPNSIRNTANLRQFHSFTSAALSDQIVGGLMATSYQDIFGGTARLRGAEYSITIPDRQGNPIPLNSAVDQFLGFSRECDSLFRADETLPELDHQLAVDIATESLDKLFTAAVKVGFGSLGRRIFIVLGNNIVPQLWSEKRDGMLVQVKTTGAGGYDSSEARTGNRLSTLQLVDPAKRTFRPILVVLDTSGYPDSAMVEGIWMMSDFLWNPLGKALSSHEEVPYRAMYNLLLNEEHTRDFVRWAKARPGPEKLLKCSKRLRVAQLLGLFFNPYRKPGKMLGDGIGHLTQPPLVHIGLTLQSLLGSETLRMRLPKPLVTGNDNRVKSYGEFLEIPTKTNMYWIEVGEDTHGLDIGQNWLLSAGVFKDHPFAVIVDTMLSRLLEFSFGLGSHPLATTKIVEWATHVDPNTGKLIDVKEGTTEFAVNCRYLSFEKSLNLDAPPPDATVNDIINRRAIFTKMLAVAEGVSVILEECVANPLAILSAIRSPSERVGRNYVSDQPELTAILDRFHGMDELQGGHHRYKRALPIPKRLKKNFPKQVYVTNPGGMGGGRRLYLVDKDGRFIITHFRFNLKWFNERELIEIHEVLDEQAVDSSDHSSLQHLKKRWTGTPFAKISVIHPDNSTETYSLLNWVKNAGKTKLETDPHTLWDIESILGQSTLDHIHELEEAGEWTEAHQYIKTELDRSARSCLSFPLTGRLSQADSCDVLRLLASWIHPWHATKQRCRYYIVTKNAPITTPLTAYSTRGEILNTDTVLNPYAVEHLTSMLSSIASALSPPILHHVAGKILRTVDEAAGEELKTAVISVRPHHNPELRGKPRTSEDSIVLLYILRPDGTIADDGYGVFQLQHQVSWRHRGVDWEANQKHGADTNWHLPVVELSIFFSKDEDEHIHRETLFALHNTDVRVEGKGGMKEKFMQLAENMRKWYSDGQSVIDIMGLDPAALKSICGAEELFSALQMNVDRTRQDLNPQVSNLANRLQVSGAMLKSIDPLLVDLEDAERVIVFTHDFIEWLHSKDPGPL